MSKKKKIFNSPIILTDSVSAKELAQRISSLQNSNVSDSLTQQPTGSISKANIHPPNYVDDKGKEINQLETQADYYRELYQEEKISSVYSEINSKTNLVEARLTGEIERIKTFIESKFSSYTKWGIGIIIAIIGIPIGVFYFLLSNQTEKIETTFDLKMEKRISPIENKIKEYDKSDSLKIHLQKNMPNKQINRTP